MFPLRLHGVCSELTLSQARNSYLVPANLILLCSEPTSVDPPQQQHFGTVVIKNMNSHCRDLTSHHMENNVIRRLSTTVSWRNADTCVCNYTGLSSIPLMRAYRCCHNASKQLSSNNFIFTHSRNPSCPVVTICSTRLNIPQFYVLPTQCICVFCVDLRTNSDYILIEH
jgi:hypothetical protein